jgi:cell wall-associated NlpC family hydrolase
MKKIYTFGFLTIVLGVMLGCVFTPPASEKAKFKRYEEAKFDMSNPVMRVAKSQLGVPYRYGGDSYFAFDCSGFVAYVYQKALGKRLPRTARAQSKIGKAVRKDALKSGDLLFFDTAHRGHINHTGIYIAEGQFIQASSGRVHEVTISSLKSPFYKKAFRWARRVKGE